MMDLFAIVNLGCKVNRVESDRVQRLLLGLGMQEGTLAEADIIVVNTCTVTAAADKKTRKAVRAAIAANDGARVIVTGCSAAQNPQVFEEMSPRVEVVWKWDVEDRLLRICSIGSESDADSRCLCSASMNQEPFSLSDREPSTRFRKGVKVQDGCNGACTYCIIWKARGPERSVSAANVIEQARIVCGEGASEVVLTGINLGRYRDGGADLTDLLEMLLEEELPCRYRLSSIEPPDVTQRLLSVMGNAKERVCRHLHIPLQSGSAKILQEMARPYSPERYLEIIDMVYSMLPGASVTTDVIAGFPGESDDDHLETLSLSRRCAFSKLHVFPYSMREGTPAAARPDQVPSGVKAHRAAELRELSAELRARDLEGRRGTREWAVVDDAGMCMTDSYHEVASPRQCSPGDLVEIAL